MKKHNFLLVLFLTVYSLVYGQSNTLIINDGIVLPKDSLEGEALLNSLNSFLSLAYDNSENKWILETQKLETQVLVDELIDIQKNADLDNDFFYKPYLTSITSLENGQYAVQISFIGIHENTADLRANVELITHKANDRFLISSPLKRNTLHWQTKQFNNQFFHYPNTLDLEKTQEWYDLTSLFDEKLQVNDRETHYYLCDDIMDPLELFGVAYKSDYNSYELRGRWECSMGKKDLFFMTESRFNNYPHHDLWHFRLSRVISRKEVHRRVDCHIGTLHGGIWGIGWNELFPMFSNKYVTEKDVDWLKHKKESSHFITLGRRRNYTDDFVGALLIQKIEKEKGFEGVWELLMTKRTKEEEEYFSVLAKLTGITKKNYNKEVSKLI